MNNCPPLLAAIAGKFPRDHTLRASLVSSPPSMVSMLAGKIALAQKHGIQAHSLRTRSRIHAVCSIHPCGSGTWLIQVCQIVEGAKGASITNPRAFNRPPGARSETADNNCIQGNRLFTKTELQQ